MNNQLLFNEIEKSRDLYFTRGSMVRKNLRPQIANAWHRYNLLKNKKIEIKKNTTAEFRLAKKITNAIAHLLYENSYTIYFLAVNKNIYKLENYDQKSMFYGTGGEIAFTTDKEFSVFKQEHINSLHDSKFTHGFRFDHSGKIIYVGIAGEYKNYNSKVIEKIKKEVGNSKIETSKKNMLYFDYEKKKKEIRNHKIPLLLIGSIGTGKYTFAKEYHANEYSDYKFNYINCKKEMDLQAYKIEEGIFYYFDKISYLSFKNQKELLKKVQSKLVNSSSKESSNLDNCRILMSVEMPLEQLASMQVLDNKLLTRLKPNVISFNQLTTRDNLHLYKILVRNISQEISLAAKKVILNYSWDKNYYDLKRLISYFNHKVSLVTINLKDLPKFIYEENPEITTIKANEIQLIERTLEAFDGNIKMSAESLGISRSTLYRKIDTYDIET